MKKVWIAAIVFAVIALIGLVSFIGNMRSVNAGAFILPGIVSAVLFYLYAKNTKNDKQQ